MAAPSGTEEVNHIFCVREEEFLLLSKREVVVRLPCREGEEEGKEGGKALRGKSARECDLLVYFVPLLSTIRQARK